MIEGKGRVKIGEHLEDLKEFKWCVIAEKYSL